MTRRELSQLFYLRQEIVMDERRLRELETKVKNVSPSGGCGSGGSKSASKIEIYIADIIDLKAIIAAKRQQCIFEKSRLERYIQTIPDSLTRMLFTLRFEECLSWIQIAKEVKGVTPDSARMEVNRYLEEH
mgnify:CR=1 FL=1